MGGFPPCTKSNIAIDLILLPACIRELLLRKHNHGLWSLLCPLRESVVEHGSAHHQFHNVSGCLCRNAQTQNLIYGAPHASRSLANSCHNASPDTTITSSWMASSHVRSPRYRLKRHPDAWCEGQNQRTRRAEQRHRAGIVLQERPKKPQRQTRCGHNVDKSSRRLSVHESPTQNPLRPGASTTQATDACARACFLKVPESGNQRPTPRQRREWCAASSTNDLKHGESDQLQINVLLRDVLRRPTSRRCNTKARPMPCDLCRIAMRNVGPLPGGVGHPVEVREGKKHLGQLLATEVKRVRKSGPRRKVNATAARLACTRPEIASGLDALDVVRQRCFSTAA